MTAAKGRFDGSFSAIVFDMDGLLVNSEVVWHQVEAEMLAVRGHIYTDDVRAQVIGLRLDAFFEKLKTFYNLAESIEALSAELVERFISRIPAQVEVQPGAHEIVNWVAAQAIPTAIASSSPTAIIDATVAHMGWDDIFAIRCSADDDALGKPAPDVYLRAARLLHVEPQNCLALEDSLTGARAAVAAGMTCFAVPDATHTAAAAFAEITPYVYPNLHAVLVDLQRQMDGE